MKARIFQHRNGLIGKINVMTPEVEEFVQKIPHLFFHRWYHIKKMDALVSKFFIIIN